jgi:acetyl esterase
MKTLSKGFLLTREDIDWYLLQYTGSTVPQPIPEMYPLCAKDLSGLPPALVVTAGFDPLRDEGGDYAVALRDAGVPATLREYEGLLHGFCSMAALCPVCETALKEVAADVRAMIGA